MGIPSRTFPRALIAGLAALAVSAASLHGLAPRTPTDSVAGRWTLSVVDTEESFTCAFSAHVDAGRLDGTLDCQKGQVNVAGHVDGNRFSFSFSIPTGNVNYEGEIAGDSVRGTWRDSQSDGTFSGARSAPDHPKNPARPPSGDVTPARTRY